MKPLSEFANSTKSYWLYFGFPCAAIVCIVTVSKLQIPNSGLRDSSCKSRVLDHTPQAACSNIQAPGFKFQASGSRLQAADSRFQFPSSKIQLSTFRIYAPTSSVQSPRLQLQGSGTKLNATSIGLLLKFFASSDNQRKNLRRNSIKAIASNSVFKFFAFHWLACNVFRVERQPKEKPPTQFQKGNSFKQCV